MDDNIFGITGPVLCAFNFFMFPDYTEVNGRKVFLERGFIGGIYKSPVYVYDYDMKTGKKSELLNIESIVDSLASKKSDNFELITTINKDCKTILLIGSDNNFSKYQRTSLLFFEVK